MARKFPHAGATAFFAALGLGKAKAPNSFLIGFLTTITIETTQINIPGRVSDLRDVVMNSAGVGVSVLYIKYKDTQRKS